MKTTRRISPSSAAAAARRWVNRNKHSWMSFTRLEKILWLVSAFSRWLRRWWLRLLARWHVMGKSWVGFFFSENLCYPFFSYKEIFHPGKLLLRHYKNDEIHMKGSAHFATLPHFHVPEVISTLLRPSFFSSNENFMHHFCENLSLLCVWFQQSDKMLENFQFRWCHRKLVHVWMLVSRHIR